MLDHARKSLRGRLLSRPDVESPRFRAPLILYSAWTTGPGRGARPAKAGSKSLTSTLCRLVTRSELDRLS